ncbi:MAG TPA: glycosyltransferase family 39 protein [Jatrophihabitans sp.]|nr:glycosyltransferase family 39 protein [Jatrophihabitans sp.]
MSAQTLTWPPPPPPTFAPPVARRRWSGNLLRGRDTDAGWIRPTLLGLLLATAVLYLWGLGASGYANSFYSAAAQAGSVSWKALFFGSSDAANSITVDKTPAAIWVMALSVRLFGLNSWSILAPQALEGVASVGLLYLAVRRTSGAAAGLIAGAVLAVTPVAALMFRFNNPDALLVLLLILGAYCLIRAVESGSTKWLAWAGALVGFGFLTKMLQALLVVPAFALVYLVAAPNPLRRRIGQLLSAGAALVVSAGWWVAIVSLIPAADRPYIGGSQHNSILELTLGYNGFGRLTGNETGSVGGGGPAGNVGGMWGSTGASRLFGTDMGTQISWLLPSALLLLVAGLWFTRKAIRTDRTRAALMMWGGWLLVTGLVFSYAKGIIHPYYTVALAPAIGGIIGIGATLLWRYRHLLSAAVPLALTVLLAAGWQFMLLDRTPTWLPWLRYAILVAGVASALLLLVVSRMARQVGTVIATVALVAGVAGPSAYAVSTARTPHTGAIPSAGPASAGGFGGPGGRLGGGGAGRFAGPPTGGFAGGAFGGTTGGFAGGPGGLGRGGGGGGLLNASTPSAALVAALKANASSYTWVAAAVGSNTAAGYQLASQEPVMPVGGFNGSDPSPTLAQFQAYVAAGKIHYFIGGGGFGGNQQGGSNSSAAIANWVASNFKTVTIGGTTLYDLTQPSS